MISIKNVIIILIIGILILFAISIYNYKPLDPPKVVFDIPPLIGKDIDQINSIMDTLNTKGVTDLLLKKSRLNKDEPLNSSEKHWSKNYAKDGYILSVNYNPQTREVYSFLIVSKDRDFDKFWDILKIGNLNSYGANYTTETDTASWSWSHKKKYYDVTVYPNK